MDIMALNASKRTIVRLSVEVNEGHPQDITGRIRFVSREGVVFKPLQGKERYFPIGKVNKCIKLDKASQESAYPQAVIVE